MEFQRHQTAVRAATVAVVAVEPPGGEGDRMTGGVVVVAGGGGFIGGHLTRRLLSQGREVRVVDCKPVDEWQQVHPDADNRVLDLRLREACDESLRGAGEVFNLA